MYCILLGCVIWAQFSEKNKSMWKLLWSKGWTYWALYWAFVYLLLWNDSGANRISISKVLGQNDWPARLCAVEQNDFRLLQTAHRRLCFMLHYPSITGDRIDDEVAGMCYTAKKNVNTTLFTFWENWTSCQTWAHRSKCTLTYTFKLQRANRLTKG